MTQIRSTKGATRGRGTKRASPSSSSKKAKWGHKRKLKGGTLSDSDIRAMVPTGLGHAFVESKLHEKRMRESGLQPPPDWQGEMPELPEDVASTDHDELSQLMTDFQAAVSTSAWQASMAYIESDILDDVAEYLENQALLDSDQSNDTKRKASAKVDDRVVAVRALQKTRYHDYKRYETLTRQLEGKVKVISRVGGFKEDDNDASDLRSRKGSTRGRARKRRRDDDE